MGNERARLIGEIATELLGPRFGASEILPNGLEPKFEYQTGQLFPLNIDVSRNPDSDHATEDGIDQDDSEEESIIPTYFSMQNSNRLPNSLGISFCINRDPAEGDFEVCLTWARYQLDANRCYRRIPKYFIVSFVKGTTEYKDPNQNDIRLDIRISKNSLGNTKVSIFLTSLVTPESQKFAKNEEIIFQPEIRVRLADGVLPVELNDGGFVSTDEEWKISTHQYNERKVFARGHLCGAYWNQIDPQRKFRIQFANIPFVWIDGEYLKGNGINLDRFFSPDFRTDFLPLYSVPSPEYGHFQSDSLSAKRLYQADDKNELKLLLEKFVKSYTDWISNTERTADLGNSIEVEILNRHRQTLRRISEGVEFIVNDDVAFQSFRFMNEAMSIQTNWSRKGKELVWRPFQLGFICLCVKSAVIGDSAERSIADTLWFPTGGGKSEAYLGLASFVAFYRRGKSVVDTGNALSGSGTAVISRYTLRLLTLQQYRRALRVICAMEFLRLKYSKNIDPRETEKSLSIGGIPFSIGLWVGGDVTPNKLKGKGFEEIPDGAIELLRMFPMQDKAEAAQILNCPCCNGILAIPINGLSKGSHELNQFSYAHVALEKTPENLGRISSEKIIVKSIDSKKHGAEDLFIFSLSLDVVESVDALEIQKWWDDKIIRAFESKLELASIQSPLRPGYIPHQRIVRRRTEVFDFEIRCPNPECDLHKIEFSKEEPSRNGSVQCGEVHEKFKKKLSTVSFGMPIPAVTVDEKLFSNPPTFLISTCDKFATMALNKEAETAAFFGRVRSYSSEEGYKQVQKPDSIPVTSFRPPDLIIQDELHLLDGPLGSIFGIYETVIDELCKFPKYITSSATIRNANEQIKCLLSRESNVFPPVNIKIDDGFFLQVKELHPLDEAVSGRLFIGVATPGKAAQTPLVRIWSTLLQSVKDFISDGLALEEADYFWTVVGYYNAIRELANGESMWRQDISQRIQELVKQRGSKERREINSIEMFRNLSSQTDSSALPGILASLERELKDGDAVSGVGATSMFGTGVDVDRLSLMVVNGQPKSASSYIQAVGRIGRKRAGLAVVFLRAAKPRDLNHYEYFTGYHRRLAVAVEPISVKPFAPRAIERTLGTLIVALLRNLDHSQITLPQGIELQNGALFVRQIDSTTIDWVVSLLKKKWDEQPDIRKSKKFNEIEINVKNAFDRWKLLSEETINEGIRTLNYTDMSRKHRQNRAVLGPVDYDDGRYAFSRAPTSLRDVESTIKIRVRD